MAKPAENKEFDIVVFGATGFTGQFVVEEIAKTEDEEGQIKWAIAGRNVTKLRKVLEQASKYTGKNLEKIPILQTDINSEESLNDMCRQARVILNCVGPYQFYGEPVVRACVQNKAHHVDISGEPVFLEKTQLDYDAKAKAAGVYIMECCGFDSIPSDMGVVYMRDQFKGDLNHIEDYLTINIGPDGARLNFGTFQSGIHGYNIGKFLELRKIRKQMGLKPMPMSIHSMPKRAPLFYSNLAKGWCLPFAGADKFIVQRSQRYNYEQRKERPIQFEVFMCLPNLLYVLFMMLLGLSFAIFSNFSLGRKLMEKFPLLMSFGLFDKKGPTRKQMAGTSFIMKMIGHGHETKLNNVDEQHEDKPTRKIITTITGPELAYVTTPICMVQAAYTMLKEQDKLPQGGGVFTPGAAFAKTSLIERLNKHNVKFETIQQ